MFLYIFIPALLYVLYKVGVAPYSYWKDRGVLYKQPVPIFGNLAKLIFQRISFYDAMCNIYNNFRDERYHGGYQFTRPALVIHDLDLLKQILVKDFDHFTDHRGSANEEIEPIFAKNLFQLKGENWRDMRALLSPAFTGSKMKAMFHLMTECGAQMPSYLKKCDDEGVHELEMKDLFTRYTNDVIATCAFGASCNSLVDKENTFYMMGKDVTDVVGFRALKFLLINFCPNILVKILKPRLFPKEVTDFFYTTIKDSVAYRARNGIIRPDMVHLLMEARKGKLRHEDKHEAQDTSFAVLEESSIGKREINVNITDMDIASQAFIFFFAGFDTTSTLLSFMAIELANNPDVQEKLHEEVDQVMKKCDGDLTYDAVVNMKYMDMVVSETLRKWPPVGGSDRMCTKEYTIPAVRPQERDLLVEVGINVTIPILGLQRDERYFPDPEKFDPERFSEDNKHKIIPFTYMPFGLGPRGCIGSRFALLEIKVVFLYVLYHYELVPSGKTSMPMKLSKRGFKIQPEDGFWVGFKARRS